jgi:hypothetical protein
VTAWAVSGALTLVGLEGALRLLFPLQLGDPASHIGQSEAFFFEGDAGFGWSLRPGASGTFTNGLYRGNVHVDSRGVRENGVPSTRRRGAPAIFVIGDSNAGGFEVDDEETLSAILERQLRAAGEDVNVLNLGVRRYGTDQAVLRALSLQDLTPRIVLYLYTHNDPFDTNVLHIPGRELGKGTFIRRLGEATFSPHNYPVPDYPLDYAGVTILDRQCQPIVHERMVEPEEPDTLVVRAKRYLWTLRAISYIRRGPPGPPAQLLEDPIDLAEAGSDFHPDLYTTFHEHGPIRARCPEYFEAQMAALLMRLRKIPTVARVLVAHFPDNLIFGDLRAGRVPPSVEMFERLAASGVIDGYVNLGQRFVEQELRYRELACPGDGHFCEDGIAWEAREIFDAFSSLLRTVN